MSEPFVVVAITLALMLLIALGGAVVMWRCYRRIVPGEALVIFSAREPRVSMHGTVVLPSCSAPTIDLTTKTLRFERRGELSLLTKPSEAGRVEIDVVVALRVQPTRDDILKVATRIGCAESYRIEIVRELFGPRIESAIATVVRHVSYDDLLGDRPDLEHKMIEVIGNDLDGFILDRLAIERVERAP